MKHVALLLLSSLAACSVTTAPGTPAPGTTPPNVDAGAGAATTGTETWRDGKTLDTNVVIPPGATVTIAPGATITASSGVSIIVEGTLTASASAMHATITGAPWAGILVAGSGTLALDGVDLTGAVEAVHVQGGNAGATYDHGTITGATNPFDVDESGKLSTSHATVIKPHGKTRVAGAFTASYLAYDTNDQFGLYAQSPTAAITVDDSTFTNSGPNGSTGGHDVINAFGAASIHVAYTEIGGTHCGFHFEKVDAFQIDHVTVHDTTNAADLWGSSSVGTRTITNSNFEKATADFVEDGVNGPINVTGCYFANPNNLVDAKVQITGTVTARIADARPR
jgi:hypothetical protein